MLELDIPIWEKQLLFVQSNCFETLYGGAAGGGKSFAQVFDALRFALEFPGSKQIIFRKTYKELEMSIVPVAHQMYPAVLAKYKPSEHLWQFKNGSLIYMAYMARDDTVYNFQSAEFDVVRFDELTHFTAFQYTYMKSRIRGGNGYPKMLKSSTNPGNIGHMWVKERFIDPAPPMTPITDTMKVGPLTKKVQRIFIPAKVTDNGTILKNDIDYLFRLEALSENEKRALRDGDWSIFEGQYFTEWSSLIHVCKPFTIPSHWRKYRAFDYGLDRFACMWVAVSPENIAYVYREYCRSDLNIARAASEALAHTPQGEDIYCTLAPRDMWSREPMTGQSKASIFASNGLPLTETSVDRESGWLSIKELLDPGEGAHPKLMVFENCTELIKCLPMLLKNPDRPTDCLTEPHEITHAPDALRYFCVYWHTPNPVEPGDPGLVYWADDMWEDYERASSDEKIHLLKMWGRPKPRS